MLVIQEYFTIATTLLVKRKHQFSVIILRKLEGIAIPENVCVTMFLHTLKTWLVVAVATVVVTFVVARTQLLSFIDYNFIDSYISQAVLATH